VTAEAESEQQCTEQMKKWQTTLVRLLMMPLRIWGQLYEVTMEIRAIGSDPGVQANLSSFAWQREGVIILQ
jgi:hypothetical protein